jgi:methylthioribose-1-phosphate isomerase
MSLRPLKWENDALTMLDQRKIPLQTEYLHLTSSADVAAAIRDMAVRGAPAIGIAAAYGMALAVLHHEELHIADKRLRASRPTAVNLFWALDRIQGVLKDGFPAVLREAQAIEAEDLAMNLAIGEHGNALVPQGARILTICNTGALATAGHGTALGIIRTAHAAGKNIFVTSCETRPRQQGLRLTAYELTFENIPFRSIADSVAASLMRAGEIDLVVAGADRIAANGDSANKIGTYSLAVLAKHHGIPFYIAAPTSTFDPTLANGDLIPIEERDPRELTESEGVRIAPENTPVYNPGFDVTPGELITAIVSEKGVFYPPYNFA